MPVESLEVVGIKETRRAGPGSIPVEVLVNDLFANEDGGNQPNYCTVNDDGSLFVCFGRQDNEEDESSRDRQIWIHVIKPAMSTEELRNLVQAWFALRRERMVPRQSRHDFQQAKRDFSEVNSQLLDLISRPAMVSFRKKGVRLFPVEPGTKLEGSFIMYTTFEDDEQFELPDGHEEKSVYHGRFGRKGHVVAFVAKNSCQITFFQKGGKNGHVIQVIPAAGETVSEKDPITEDAHFVTS